MRVRNRGYGRPIRLQFTCILVLLGLLLVPVAPLAQPAGEDDGGADDPGPGEPSSAETSRQSTEPFPDLTIMNITLATEDPVDGSKIGVFATVSNIGDAVAEDFTAKIYRYGGPISTTDIPSLGPGNTTTISAKVKVGAGYLELKAMVDVRNTVRERSEANNLLVRTIPVPSADLRMADITYSPSNFSNGDTVLLTATVVNDGSDTLSSFDVLIRVDDRLLVTQRVKGLGSGDSMVISAQWDAVSGSHEILSTIDPDDRITEFNESNNDMIAPIGAPFPDLVVDDLFLLTPQANITDGDMVLLDASISNRGRDTHSPFTVRMMVDGHQVSGSVISGLWSGGVANVTFKWRAEAGDHVMRVDVDGREEILESREDNNHRLLDVNIHLPDLRIMSLDHHPFHPADGMDLNLSVRVANMGNGGTNRTVDLHLYSNGVLTRQISIPGGIGPNTTTYSNFTISARAGRMEMALVVDPVRRIQEMDEGNNRILSVIEVSRPDLHLTNLTVTEGLEDGELGDMGVTVLNSGPGNTTRTFFVDFFVEGKNLARVPVHGLSANSSRKMDIPFRAVGGTLQVSARVDGDARIAEADEGNNLAFDSIHIPIPDLAVQDLVWSPVSPAPGEMVDLTAIISNEGAPTEREVPVQFWADGRAISTVVIDGSSFVGDVNVDQQWLYQGDTERLEVRIDPFLEIGEAAEDNNVLAREFPDGSTVSSPSSPDFMVQELTWLPAKPDDGEETSVVVTLGNRGDLPGPDADVQALYTPPVTLLVDNQVVSTERIEVLSDEAMVVMSWKARAGHHAIGIVVDREGIIPESNETNNAFVRTVDIGRSDIVLQDLEFVSARPDDGNEITIFLEILNQGNRTLDRFPLRYYVDGLPAGKEMVEGALLNRSTTVSHVWTATPGEHTIDVVADPEGILIEGVENNNVVSGQISINIADLVVESLLVADEVDDGTGSLVTAHIRNNGTGGTVRTFSTAFLIDGVIVDREEVDGLPAGGDLVLSSVVDPGPGKHVLRVAIDTEGSIVEGTEDDNALTRSGLNVTSSDLVVNYMEIISQDDRSTLVSAEIGNRANTTMRWFSVAFYSDGEVFSTHEIQGLPGGRNTTVTAAWSHMFGSHRVRVVVDPWNRITELDETNNERVVNTSFVPYPDLYVDETEIIGPMVPGSSLTIVAKVRNIGGPVRSPFNLRFMVNGATAGERTVYGLPGEGNVYLTTTLTGVVGHHHLRIVVDPVDAIPEVNEMNNAQVTTYTVKAPDLEIRGLQMYNHPHGVAIFARVRNQGAHLLSSVRVEFLADGTSITAEELEALPSFTSTTIMGIVPSDATTVKVVVDPWSDMPEVDDANNEITLPLVATSVEGSPDLKVTDIFWVPQFPADGQEVDFFAVVENAGNGTAMGETIMDFKMDGVKKGAGFIYGVPAGGTTIFSSSWEVATGEDINISARVNRDSRVKESDMTNNRFNQWLNVTAPDLEISSVSSPEGLYGEGSTIFVDIENTGDGDFLGGFFTDIYIEGEKVTRTRSDTVPAGSNMTLALDTDMPWGDKEILIKVDTMDEVAEVSEGNVWLSQLRNRYPDLTITDLWYETGVNSSTYSAFVEVMNRGEGIATDFQLGMRVNDKDLGDKHIPALGTNSTAILAWPFQKTRVREMSAFVDPVNRVPESNELNNRLGRDDVGNDTYIPPDVNLHLLDLNISQYGTPNNHYRLDITMENQGENISFFHMDILMDGELAAQIGLEDMGNNTTRTVSVDLRGQAERHIFKVVLDSHRDIAEDEERDNEMRRVIGANTAPIPYPGKDQTVTEGDRAIFQSRGYDPDGRIVTYEWDFDGDGTYEWSSNRSKEVRHRFNAPPSDGRPYYTAVLRVTDDRGAVSTDTIRIRVVKEKPWFEPPPDDLSYIVPFAVGTACIAAAIMLFYLMLRGYRPFRETEEEKEIRRKREKDKGFWPPWKRSVRRRQSDSGSGPRTENGKKE